MNAARIITGGASALIFYWILVTMVGSMGGIMGAEAAVNDSVTLAGQHEDIEGVSQDVTQNLSGTVAESYIWLIDIGIQHAHHSATFGYHYPHITEWHTKLLPVNWIAALVLLHWSRLRRLLNKRRR